MHAGVTALGRVVPAPASVRPVDGASYTLPSDATIQVQAGAAPVTDIGHYLAAILRRSTGYALPVTVAGGPPTGGISLLLTAADGDPGAAHDGTGDDGDAEDGDGDPGDEGCRVDVDEAKVVIRARTPAGLFHGVQTLRQLLPATVESPTVRPGPWEIAGCRIVDRPRFPYRGAMLDVVRHFFDVEVVKRYVDRLALYKINYLHLHLTDDQGWRIAIDAWPRLAEHGGSSQVGGGPGGYYTKAEYRDLVSYAASRYITIVPEIDVPGHTNAALAAYPELNCDGVAPASYTGVDVGFSSLCVDKDVTYTFLRNVVEEVSALTPGPYLHLGGDEADSTPPKDYDAFVNRVQRLVTESGKTVIGWHQLGSADHSPGRIAQYWGTGEADDEVVAAVRKGAKVLMSPADRAYLDMKYDASTRLGLSWAGFIDVRTAYDWDPGTHLPAVPESSVLGVEAPLWTETVVTPDDLDVMTFPRLPAIAELGWSPRASRDWSDFRIRLAAHGPRWTALGIGFHRSVQVPWDTPPATLTPGPDPISSAGQKGDHS